MVGGWMGEMGKGGQSVQSHSYKMSKFGGVHSTPWLL